MLINFLIDIFAHGITSHIGDMIRKSWDGHSAAHVLQLVGIQFQRATIVQLGSRCGWPSGSAPAAEAPVRLGIFPELPPCLVGIEACASSHYWSRELLALGHTVRLMPP